VPDEQLDENFYLHNWEIKEMHFTKNRRRIKAVVKKNRLIYMALIDVLK
jgi:hypothetical protein